ncbi:MAG: hypothetical protein IJM14_05535 [Lachnospiraceae bacterium]|nr:hypothetical protein [Lachnospiraceae bacterium]
MNKKTSLWIALDLVFLAIFNIVFFVVGGTDHTASVWVSYVFIHFAYFMMLLAPFLIKKSSGAVVFGFSIYTISSIYFIVEFVVGTMFILLKQDSYKPALIFQIVIAGIYAIFLFSHLIANEYTADSIERHEQEVAYIKEASLRVKMIMEKVMDKSLNCELEKIYDLIHSSPSKSNIAVSSLEKNIVEMIGELEKCVINDKKEDAMLEIKKIKTAMEERNNRLRYKYN